MRGASDISQLAGSYGSFGEPGPAGSYTRLSALPAEYDPFSPENQRRLSHEAAVRNGERISPEFEFEDFASGRKDIERPGLERALRALLEGQIRTLYVAKTDRLSRRGMGHIGLILDRLEQVGGRIIFVADGLDSSQQGARQVIAILAEQARAEADATSWRMGQWHAHNRREGLWKKKRPYGYRTADGKLEPHPLEAKVVERIVNEFLGGASLRNIATGLNRDGIDCPNAAKHDEAKAAGRRVKPLVTRRWSYITVRSVLLAPSLAALVSHKGQLVRNQDGDPIFAGKGIVKLSERARILAEFERRGLTIRSAKDPERIGKRTGGGRPAKYLLTGFLYCSLCTAAMTRSVGRRGRERAALYRCARNGRGHQCAGLSIYAEDVEAEVLHRYFAKLATLEPGDPLLEGIAERWLALSMPEGQTDRIVLADKLHQAEASLADLYEARYTRGEFGSAKDHARYEDMRMRLSNQRDATQEALDKLGPPPRFDLGLLLDAELSREGWPDLPLHRQREFLRLAVSRVYILPSQGRGWHATPAEDRVKLLWAGARDPYKDSTE